MKLRNILFVVCLMPYTNALADRGEYESLCKEDAVSVGLTGSDLNDYVADCISQYGVDEPSYEEEYVEDDYQYEEPDETPEPEISYN